SYLIASGDEQHEEKLAEMVQRVVQLLSDVFSAFLLLEIWAGPEIEPEQPTAPFHIFTPRREDSEKLIEHMQEALQQIPLINKQVEVRVSHGRSSPPGLSPLIPTSHAKETGCLLIGLEVPPVYRDAASG